MPRIQLISTNKKTAILLAVIITAFGLITIFIPLLMIRLIPQSGVGNYFLEHLYYGYFSIPILLYFIYIGVFYYQIKIDSYIINIRSHRIISGIFKSPNYIDISHIMLSEVAFFNRPFSFNKTLMLKITTDAGKKITKRFNLTFLSKRKEEKITTVLNQIIAKNR